MICTLSNRRPMPEVYPLLRSLSFSLQLLFGCSSNCWIGLKEFFPKSQIRVIVQFHGTL